ncbi:MAG TPA: tRNA lysidine(34) synthetase TilS [Terracidiphilus sp.]|jgi:tRNA(Ile)-lysidine synthase|nr:tRNA lysidine(34) synthetase TilS [Terracidiphilus sp.]
MIPLVPSTLPLDTSLLRPGLRLAVGLSGGADSVALLCALAEQSRELGLVLHAAHLHHGLRGEEADADLEFARSLAQRLEIPIHSAHVDTATEAKTRGESIEEAARRLRYQWFRDLLSEREPHAVIDAVATGHTLDDQAETVLAKFLRGAWTEGLSGIYPTLEMAGGGRIIRPLLTATHAEIEAWLRVRNQPWREDSSNRDIAFTRNRIRHELLPQLETWNPRLREHLAHMAALARDEEAWAQVEVARIAPQRILPGRPVRGGGRAATEGLAVDISRLAELPPALQRRFLRYAAEQAHAALDFAATESLLNLALRGRAGQKLEIAGGLRVERSHRELRFTTQAPGASGANSTKVARGLQVSVPGEIDAPALGIRLRLEATKDASGTQPGPQTALLRPWRAGDRVRLRYSSGQRKVKEVLERLKVSGTDRAAWPVLEYNGSIVWMKGVEVDPNPFVRVIAAP